MKKEQIDRIIYYMDDICEEITILKKAYNDMESCILSRLESIEEIIQEE